MNGRDRLTKLVQTDMEISQQSVGKMYVCQVRVYLFWYHSADATASSHPVPGSVMRKTVIF